MQRSKLRNLFLKKRTEENRNNYVKQRNLCVTLLRKSKREFFGSLNETHLCDNKKFWGVVKPLLSSKVVYNERITLVEDDKIIENDKNTASILNEFFCLNKYQNILNLSYQNFNVVLENGIVVSTVY